MLLYNITDHLKNTNTYTELRLTQNSDVRVVLLNGVDTANARSQSAGVLARSVKNGRYGVASSSVITKDSIADAIKNANHNACFLAQKGNAERGNQSGFEMPKTDPYTHGSFTPPPQQAEQKRILEFVRQIDSYIEKSCPDLASRYVAFSHLTMERVFSNTFGVNFSHYNPRSIIIISLTTMDKQGMPVDLYEPIGGPGMFDQVFQDPKTLCPAIDRIYNNLMLKKEGVFAAAGLKTCVFDADLAGILAHEAIGHTTEADLVLGGSVASFNLNKQVASPLISLTDFAHTALGATCPVPVYVDDEGTVATDAQIIKDGILTSYMHNKESAIHFGAAPTGNARAFSFADEPLIRMRNTAILPGKDKLEDMLASIDDGYYFTKTGNGQADSTGEFMFAISMGFEVKGGKLGRAIKDTTISGMAFDVLSSVDAVSDQMSWNCSGMCGKKQHMMVGMGGPAIKCKVNVGGR